MAAAKPKYPKVVVTLDLSGPQGNAYVVMGAVQNGLEKIGVSKDEIDQYVAESTGGDYENLLATARRWVTFNAIRVPPTIEIRP